MKYEQVDKVLTELNITGIRNVRSLRVCGDCFMTVAFEDLENIKQVAISLGIDGGDLYHKAEVGKKILTPKTPKEFKNQLEKIINVFKENVEKFYSTLEDELKKI